MLTKFRSIPDSRNMGKARKQLIARASTRGRVTIPIELRRKHGIKGGTCIVFVMTRAGIEMRPKWKD